ncbi:hypothetical protein KC19_2G211700 [Ceratodon purpureus]|uniref:TIR domain-containing protein n=1 Tax=Ceratodon purpureus TaxID=3225 RepID=A0A8T0IYR9_CERPU|nr:hypothetical protein KC19_2G211700 [Ceratodon purpureus]
MKRKWEQERAGTSHAVMDGFDVFLNHRGPDVKATFVAHLEEALRCAGFRPFLDARSLMKGNPAFQSIDQALDVAMVHVAVVSKRYAESKYCLNEVVAMMRSGKPVIPVFYDVEPVDLRWVENGPFAEAFEKHKSRGRTETKLQEWRVALQALSEITGFRSADYKRDEALLKRDVVNEVSRLTPSNQPVEVEQFRVGLESSVKGCIQILEDMGAGPGMLGLVGMGGIDGFANYDVFISHRGPDTKTGFVSFLHRDLEAAGLLAFLDCKSIDMGEDSWECIEDAIRKTPIAVVVFSESFAQSEWCLRELHVMLHTPSVKVLPVFYKVRPSEVRFPESGQLKDGFQKLIGRHDKNSIEQWRADLEQASKLMGWEHAGAQGRLEGDLVKEIVEKVLNLANKPLPLFVGDYVVGIKEVVEDIIQTIETKKTILMLGLWGMGGIGKSTLARELYNRLRGRFDASCYIEDVTEKVLQGGVVKVQNLILKDLCRNEAHIVVEDKSRGKTILEERLSKNRVLLVLDDVCDSDAMGFWITRKMLSNGSLCMVTSRDRRVFELSCSLDMNEEVHIQHVQGLSDVDCRRVFASYAFGGVSKVKPELERMVASISKACGGVPLVLKVCGSLLKNEANVLVWNEVMEKLNTGFIMNEEKIFGCLRMSYDTLQEEYQEMFLDISCALIGERCSYAICVWNASGWSASLGVRTLVERALVTVDGGGRFNMHDHLRDMGREIERKGRMGDGVIRRLWMPKFLALLEEDEELPTSLQTLIAHNHKSDTEGHRHIDMGVSHLKELRIFLCKGDINVTTSLPKNVVWIGFRQMNNFPVIPEMNRLVIMDLESSSIRAVCDSVRNASKLEMLNLSYCSELHLLPHSFGMLKRLRDINLRCSGIQSLPESFGELSNLEVLNLTLCSQLRSLPHSFGMLKRLRDIQLGLSGIQSLPESFGELINLEVLNLSSCSQLCSLPHSFGMLKRLRDIQLGLFGIQSLPESFGELSNLEVLILSYCHKFRSLPHSFGMLKRLRDINLEWSGIQSLPESFGELSNLEVLNLTLCSQLRSLPHSFGMLKRLRDISFEWSGIQSLPESFGELSNLEVLNLRWCSELSSLPHSFGMLKRLRDINLQSSGIQSLPESFGELSNLEVQNLSGCYKLSLLPHSFGMLKKLRDINLYASRIQSLPESFGELSSLEVLNLSRCSQLNSLPHSFGMLKRLREIKLEGSGIQSLPESDQLGIAEF